jgi:hypothetical protein
MPDRSKTDHSEFRGEIPDHRTGPFTSEAQADEWNEAFGNYHEEKSGLSIQTPEARKVTRTTLS